MYIAVDHETAGSASTNLAACTTAIYGWLLHNCFDSKSRQVVVSYLPHGLQNQVDPQCRLVTGTQISLSHCVKSLGVIFDENLKFSAHVSAVGKGCLFP